MFSWSQSRLPNGVLTGNFLFCSSVVLSGNNYAKLALFGRFLNMGVPGRSSFTRIQTHYVVPQVNRYWEMTQAGILRQLKDKEVVIAGNKTLIKLTIHFKVVVPLLEHHVMSMEVKQNIKLKDLHKYFI